MSFEGKVVLVTGGSGVVGSGIIANFLKEGATVIAPSRTEKGADSLRDELREITNGKLDTRIADVSNVESVKSLSAQVADQYGTIDHVVTSVGGWWQKGTILQFASIEESTAEIERGFHNYVLSHFILAKAFIPMLKPSPESVFIFITGSIGEGVFVPEAGMLTFLMGGLYGLIMTVQAEFADKPYPRINEARISALIKRPAEAAAEGPPFSNLALGKLVVAVAAGSKKNELVRIGEAELKAVSSA